MTAARDPASQRRFVAWLSPRLDVLVGLCGAGLFLPWLSTGVQSLDLGALPWLIDLAANWQWPIATLLVCCILLRTLFGVTMRLVLLPLALMPWVTATAPLQPATTPAPGLSIAAINLHVSEVDASGLRAYLDTHQPDLVVLSELNPHLAASLPAFDDYPEQHVAAEDSPFGIGVLSRLALQDVRVHADANGLAEIDLSLRIGERRVLATLLHPMPPLSPTWHQARRAKLDAAVKRQAAFDGPRLIIGDLNATPWSSALRTLPGDYQRATTLAPTWPAWLLPVSGLPIDQVLASPHWRVAATSVDPSFGSDHAPVRVTLQLATEGAP